MALSEYETSIEDGRFAKPVEYQDSRGFVWQAERMIEGAAAELAKADAEALAKIRARIRRAQGGLAGADAARGAGPAARPDVGADLRHRAARLEVLMASSPAANASCEPPSPLRGGVVATQMASDGFARLHRRPASLPLLGKAEGTSSASSAARLARVASPRCSTALGAAGAERSRRPTRSPR